MLSIFIPVVCPLREKTIPSYAVWFPSARIQRDHVEVETVRLKVVETASSAPSISTALPTCPANLSPVSRLIEVPVDEPVLSTYCGALAVGLSSIWKTAKKPLLHTLFRPYVAVVAYAVALGFP